MLLVFQVKHVPESNNDDFDGDNITHNDYRTSAANDLRQGCRNPTVRGASAKAGCSHIHVEASLSLSLSHSKFRTNACMKHPRGAERKPGATV